MNAMNPLKTVNRLMVGLVLGLALVSPAARAMPVRSGTEEQAQGGVPTGSQQASRETPRLGGHCDAYGYYEGPEVALYFLFWLALGLGPVVIVVQ